MPIVTVTMFSGRTQTEKDGLAEAITEDIIKILKVEKKRGNSSNSRTDTWELVCVRYSGIGHN